MAIGPTMQWQGSSDPEIKSGQATFFYLDDDQKITLRLPDFATAFALDRFIQTIYKGGKMAGASEVQFAVENALRQIHS